MSMQSNRRLSASGWVTLLGLIGFFLAAAGHSASATEVCPPAFGPGESFVVVKPSSLASMAITQEQRKDITVQISIIRGRPANPPEWPATLVMCTSDGKYCTITVVGIRVVLTAAHCFDQVRPAGGGPITGMLRLPSGSAISITCTTHPDYKPFDRKVFDTNGHKMKVEWSADVAVCKASSDLPVPVAERLAPPSNCPKPGSNIILVGYGCTLPNGGGAAETLYVGPASIEGVEEKTFFIHTKRKARGGEAALCDGDSGGASFDKEGRSRGVCGINSLTNELTDSWLTDTGRPEIRTFIKHETDDDPASHVCGVHPDARGCRPIAE